MLYTLDDDDRADAIERGLSQGDRDVSMLGAAALAHAGPQLALALPEVQRIALVDHLAQGMHVAGGLLDAIAAQYTAALRDRSTDWAATQAALHQSIARVDMLMEASEKSHVKGNYMRAEGINGPVNMTIRASGETKVMNNSQTASEGSAQKPDQTS